MEKMEKEKKKKIKLLNNIYMIFLIIILIITLILSFRTGMQMYYLMSTDLNDKDIPAKGTVAEWKFEVKIEY